MEQLKVQRPQDSKLMHYIKKDHTKNTNVTKWHIEFLKER